MSANARTVTITLEEPIIFETPTKAGKIQTQKGVLRNYGIFPIALSNPRTSRPEDTAVSKFPIDFIPPGGKADIEITYSPKEDEITAPGEVAVFFSTRQRVRIT
jgi:hypothetical protein